MGTTEYECNLCGRPVRTDEQHDIPPFGLGAALMLLGERVASIEGEGEEVIAICASCEAANAGMVGHPDER